MSWGHFWQYLSSPAPQIVLGLALAVTLCVVAAYVISKIRRGLRESDADASSMITNFRDLHSRGELSDEEYRTIKARLAERLQRQLELPERKQELSRDQQDLTELEGFGQDTEQDG